MADIPLAISPSVRSPGLAVIINLLAAASSPGTAPLRALIIAVKSSAGSITPDTQLSEAVAGPDAVKALVGPGTPGHLAAKGVFTEHPLALVDIVAPLEPAGVAATQTVTFDDTSPVTAARTVTVELAGRSATITWGAGVSDISAATLFVAAVNALGDDLPLTAANGGGTLDVATLTFKHKGTIGNDVQLFLTVSGGAGGNVTLGAATLAGGTLEPSLVNVLTLVKGREYDYILPCVSNTDADAASATSGPGRVKTHIETLNTGLSAKLQQQIVGVTGSVSSVKTGTAQHNHGYSQYIFCNQGRSLGCEWGGAEMGARLREEALDAAVNRINMPYKHLLYGPRDMVANELSDVQVEDLLQSGVTGVTFTPTGKTPRPSRPITTYFKDSNANPDDRILDTSKPTGIIRVTKDLRVAIPQQFPNKKLSKDLAEGDDEPPENVVEERDVKAFVISRLLFWASRGVLRRDKLTEAIGTPKAPGPLIVRVNPSDASQCDLVIPMAIVPPLAKFSLVAQKVA